MSERDKTIDEGLSRGLSATEIRRVTQYTEGRVPTPNSVAKYFVDKMAMVKADGEKALQRLTQIRAEMNQASDEVLGLQAQYVAYAKDLLEWCDKPREDEDPKGNGRDGPVFTDEERRRLREEATTTKETVQ